MATVPFYLCFDRAPLVLFALSAPPHAAFDVARVLAGAFDVPFWVFLASKFLGRIIRMVLGAFAGLSFGYI